MKRIGRELALLTLPVVILGGFAWWKTRGGTLERLQGAPSDILSGKPRLEIGEIKPLQMTPWDVAQGFVWGVDVTTWQGGQSPVAPGVKRAVIMDIYYPIRIFYRRGKRWTQAAPNTDANSFVRQEWRGDKDFGLFAVRRTTQIKANLSNVPRDAEEIRLRGHFLYENDYQGGSCRGAVAGPGWKFYPSGVCYFTTQSKSFDIPIVKPKQAWPKPEVSHETPLALVDAKWLVDQSNDDKFVVQIRHKDGTAWTQNTVVGQIFEILDADKKPLELWDSRNGGKPDTHNFGSYGQEQFSPQRSKSDLFVMPVWTYDVAPVGGWNSVKFPLTLRAEISDGTNWPLQIDTKIERVQMKTEDFGAAK